MLRPMCAIPSHLARTTFRPHPTALVATRLAARKPKCKSPASAPLRITATMSSGAGKDGKFQPVEKPQTQSLPGSERALKPTSESTKLEGDGEFVEYKGVGKLKGKKILITGGEYVIRSDAVLPPCKHALYLPAGHQFRHRQGRSDPCRSRGRRPHNCLSPRRARRRRGHQEGD